MPIWFWLNILACMLFFVPTAGIPLWLVLTRSEKAPAPTPGRIRDTELTMSSST